MRNYKVVPFWLTSEMLEAMAYCELQENQQRGESADFHELYYVAVRAAPDTDMVAVRRDWLLATLRGSRAAGWTIPLELQYLLDESDAEILKSWGGNEP